LACVALRTRDEAPTINEALRDDVESEYVI